MPKPPSSHIQHSHDKRRAAPLGVERANRLRHDLRRQVAARSHIHIGKVRADQVELAREGLEKIAAGEVDAVGHAVP